MKFSIVEGERREARPGLSAKCLHCGDTMIAKCGQYRVWHWAHQRTCNCDSWWKPETPWHRDWKNVFPESWQEISHTSENGEKHIADVKTENGVVLEFQHSCLHPDERDARESFYPKMVWVVNGLRRTRDRARFHAGIAAGSIVKFKPLTISFPLNRGGALIRDWAGRRAPVYFDFGNFSEPTDALRLNGPIIWRLCPRSPNGEAHLSPVLKTSFLETGLKGQPLKGIDYSAAASSLQTLPGQPVPIGLLGFQRYLAEKYTARRRPHY